MQREHCLLRLGLYSNFLARHLRRHPDGARIGGIVLVSDVERFDEFGWHQLDLVAHWLLGEMDLSSQKPERRAIERDEDAVQCFKCNTWQAQGGGLPPR